MMRVVPCSWAFRKGRAIEEDGDFGGGDIEGLLGSPMAPK